MMAVLGGNADKLTRLDLQARGDAVLASVSEGPGAGSSDAALGHLTVATIVPGVRDALRIGIGGWSGGAPQCWEQSRQPPSPPGMWWRGYADTAHVDLDYSSQSGGLGQDTTEALPVLDELPMKVDLDSLASARFTIAPPPGL